jgi:alkylation response protein AidB-like acyl-CoA dehydrogenase
VPSPVAEPSPVEELLAPPPAVSAHPAAQAAQRLARDVLAPHAAAADDPARGVALEHLAALGEAGLMGVQIPATEGGSGADARTDAETVELVAAACGATWFVATQHRTPQALSRGPLSGMPDGAFVTGPAAHRYRAGLASARTRAGIAMAHLRRPGPPAVRAEPEGTGWRLHGRADWCTGWGLIDLVMIAAVAPHDRVLFTLVPARRTAGMRAGAPLPLAVMGGTRTVALDFDGLAVGADDVLGTVHGPVWRRHDAARTANTTPASLGLLRRVLVELHAVGERRDRPAATDLALDLAGPAARLREDAYALLTQVPVTERVAQRAALRGALTALTVRAAHALVAARSGSAMLLDSPEQRWAREAAFHLVQAQTADVRDAQLAAFS